MTSREMSENVRPLLELDRAWSAYALADLDPAYVEDCAWYARSGCAALLYHGLEPPVLFMTGDPAAVPDLLPELPPGRIQFTLRAVHKSLMSERLLVSKQVRMWRMVLDPGKFSALADLDVKRLDRSNLEAIDALVGSEPDRPDAFSPHQLDTGVFYGVFSDSGLLSMAGTHVVSKSMGVAAIGNVYTAARARGRGYARASSAAVIEELLQMGISTIVLNVAMDNAPALAVYEQLGFYPYCGYYEGFGEVRPSQTMQPAEKI